MIRKGLAQIYSILMDNKRDPLIFIHLILYFILLKRGLIIILLCWYLGMMRKLIIWMATKELTLSRTKILDNLLWGILVNINNEPSKRVINVIKNWIFGSIFGFNVNLMIMWLNLYLEFKLEYQESYVKKNWMFIKFAKKSIQNFKEKNLLPLNKISEKEMTFKGWKIIIK